MDLNRLKRLEQALKQITQSRVEALFKTEIKNNQKEIVSLVRTRWEKGLRPSGDIIGTYQSFAYEQEKRSRNPLAGGNVDLIDTGDLSNELVVNYVGHSLFTIFSTDEKALKIASKYGIDVYGLTEDESLLILGQAAFRVNKSIQDDLNKI